MDRADSGATLGFAIAIRGPTGWYNAPTHYADLPADSLAAGEVGQRWAVGPWQYRFVYDRAHQTLAVFDTTLSLAQSRVVLVSLPALPTMRPAVTLGAPVTLMMSEPTSFSRLFLARAPEVRAFAGLP